jgi:hypothetical protein
VVGVFGDVDHLRDVRSSTRSGVAMLLFTLPEKAVLPGVPVDAAYGDPWPLVIFLGGLEPDPRNSRSGYKRVSG